MIACHQYQIFISIKVLLIAAVCLLINGSLNGQDICVGSLGENIFEEGDFGSGVPNIVTTNPGISPGYAYTSSPPIDDGFYILTNHSGQWPGTWPTWLLIPDNSTDPFGYMMVVNASFSPGRFYEQEVSGLCENTTYNFTADMINMIMRNVTGHILPDVTFLLDGEVKFTTGPIPQDETWHTYGFSFVTAPNQTSLTLTLRNNAPGGIGNDLALDNISFRACGPDAIASTDLDGRVCESSFDDVMVSAEIGDAPAGYVIQWQVSTDLGVTWSDIIGETGITYQIPNFISGFYQYRYLFANSVASLSNPKCRTLSTPIDIEIVPLLWTIRDTICNGNTYQFGAASISTTGIYIDSLVSSIGCDSIVTLFLEVVPDPQFPIISDFLDPNCPQYSDGSIQILDFPGANELVSMIVNEQVAVGATIFENLAAGVYPLVATDHFGCTSLDTIVLTDPPLFKNIGSIDTTIRLGQVIEAIPVFNEPVLSWSWAPIEGLSCIVCPNPLMMPLQSMIYQVTGTNANGCEALFEIRIQVDIEKLIYIPNIFSPNGDGANDFFGVFADPFATQSLYEIEVYDRWGGIVFRSANALINEKETGWDGKVDGQPAAVGAYTYVIRLSLINGDTLLRSGTVTIIR